MKRMLHKTPPPFVTPENDEPGLANQFGCNPIVSEDVLEELIAEHLSTAKLGTYPLAAEDVIRFVVPDLVSTSEKLHENAMTPELVEATWVAAAGASMVENFILKVKLLVARGLSAEAAKEQVMSGQFDD